MGRAARAIVDLSAIEHNFRLAKTIAKSAKAMAIVKADAYGHGAVAVAKKLDSIADAFGVACIEEAIELRQAGIEKPILLLEGFFTADELPIIAEHNFWTALHSKYQIDLIKSAELSMPIHVWPKFDSGMHRLGMNPDDMLVVIDELRRMPSVANIVLMTHMACADELENPMTDEQIAFFDKVIHEEEHVKIEHSLANSAAILSKPESHRQWIRSGIMMYGSSPFNQPHYLADQLKPTMRFVTEVIAIKDVDAGKTVGYAASHLCKQQQRIATVAVGYADGYDRHIPNGSPVIVAGQMAKIAGRVSMDMVTIDVTGLENVDIGSEVELWGEHLCVNEVASAAQTISYTLFTGVTKRVPRVYIN